MADWPTWWDWELELSSHLFKRMALRGFNETDLREMMERATGWEPANEPGRFKIRTRRDENAWHVIVEPDKDIELLVVITAYRVTPRP